MTIFRFAPVLFALAALTTACDTGPQPGPLPEFDGFDQDTRYDMTWADEFDIERQFIVEAENQDEGGFWILPASECLAMFAEGCETTFSITPVQDCVSIAIVGGEELCEDLFDVVEVDDECVTILPVDPPECDEADDLYAILPA